MKSISIPRLIFTVAFVAVLFGVLVACGGGESTEPSQQEVTTNGPQIVIESAWSRSTPELMESSGIVYLTLSNTGSQSDKLLAGKTPVAEAIELHEHIMDENGVFYMHMVNGGYIEIPAGESVILKPGGLHIMLINLTQALEVGTTYPLTLKFEKMGEVTFSVPVLEAAPEQGIEVEMIGNGN